MNKYRRQLPRGLTCPVTPIVGPHYRDARCNGQVDISTKRVAPEERIWRGVVALVVNCQSIGSTAIRRPQFQSIVNDHIHINIAIGGPIGVVANHGKFKWSKRIGRVWAWIKCTVSFG
jgi:hypothetical protein